jgi:hypothetical protein
MKKRQRFSWLFSFLVIGLLLGVFAVPTLVSAAPCAEACAQAQSACECGSVTVPKDGACLSIASNQGFSTVAACENAVGGGGTGTGVFSGGEQSVLVVSEAGGIFTVISTAANWVFTVLLVLSVFIIFTAAFQFVTGGSDAAALTGARAKLIWAVVGIGLALLARAIPSVVISVLKGS